MPWLGAGLPNIDSAGAGREQPLQLIVLFPVGGAHIDVQTQLAGLGLVSLAEDDRGLRDSEATGVILGAGGIFRGASADGGKLRGVRSPGRLGCRA
jgi:hypothetical protein